MHGLVDAFEHHYHNIDNDDQAYHLFRSLKQDFKESIDDYYERMMKLIGQFEVTWTDNYILSNFQATLFK